MKIIALDIGDVHTGVAYADDLSILAAPYKSVLTSQLTSLITQLVGEYQTNTIVIGKPKTLRGTESEQTRKVVALQTVLAQKFPQIRWVWWDERLTSKQARTLVAHKIKRDKNYEHEVAAAIILQSYLDSQMHELVPDDDLSQSYK